MNMSTGCKIAEIILGFQYVECTNLKLLMFLMFSEKESGFFTVEVIHGGFFFGSG